ncbi:MAG: class I tRNA ligase family protein [Nitrospirota bacterium]
MLRLFNTLQRKVETFRPVNKRVVKMFTCGPSVYQRAHIGNFRTYLFEDVLVRYLEYCGFNVQRGMNFTDIEDKSIREAEKKGTTVKQLTGENIRTFIQEMKLLRMKIPDYLPRASECVEEAVDIIEQLLKRKIAYWHRGNVYFDPLKYPGFGRLYGLDLSKWPSKKRRFHKDTYPGMQWNLGDFVLWHGYKEGDRFYWNTRIGKGRPAWNIQDPSMIIKYFNEILSIYCGGIDNLYRHHDYTMAILESVLAYPVSRYWLHCHHLYIDGHKMSKRKGNVLYTDMLQKEGYNISEIRFFLIYGHYRERLNYTRKGMHATANELKWLKYRVNKISKKARSAQGTVKGIAQKLRKVFSERMDDDLNVKGAFEGLRKIISDFDISETGSREASDIIRTLKSIDQVLNVIF